MHAIVYRLWLIVKRLERYTQHLIDIDLLASLETLVGGKSDRHGESTIHLVGGQSRDRGLRWAGSRSGSKDLVKHSFVTTTYKQASAPSSTKSKGRKRQDSELKTGTRTQ